MFFIDSTPSIQEEKANENETLVSKLMREFKDSLKEPTEQDEVNFFRDSYSCHERPQISKPVINQSKNDKEVKELLRKSAVLDPNFEKLKAVPPQEISEKKLKEQRKKEASKTTGKKWHGMPATEVTEEIKNDLELLQMRSVQDPKRFYKRSDMISLPKYFQVGKVLNSPLDFYGDLTKKQQKKTMVEELLADAEFNKYNKRKFKEIIEEKQKTHYKAWKQAKKLKKKK